MTNDWASVFDGIVAITSQPTKHRYGVTDTHLLSYWRATDYEDENHLSSGHGYGEDVRIVVEDGTEQHLRYGGCNLGSLR